MLLLMQVLTLPVGFFFFFFFLPTRVCINAMRSVHLCLPIEKYRFRALCTHNLCIYLYIQTSSNCFMFAYFSGAHFYFKLQIYKTVADHRDSSVYEYNIICACASFSFHFSFSFLQLIFHEISNVHTHERINKGLVILPNAKHL